jgi:hypothetical protein
MKSTSFATHMLRIYIIHMHCGETDVTVMSPLQNSLLLLEMVGSC